jgi:hypothetical protein
MRNPEVECEGVWVWKAEGFDRRFPIQSLNSKSLNLHKILYNNYLYILPQVYQLYLVYHLYHLYLVYHLYHVYLVYHCISDTVYFFRFDSYRRPQLFGH